MNGLELARSYYETCGRPMLEKEFPELLPYLALGFVGSGSEHFGYDDAVSQDHDYEPGFCVFLPGEDVVDRRAAFRLERAYAKLPKEYGGFRRQMLSPVGGNRNGVIRTAEFYAAHVGWRMAEAGEPEGLSIHAWLHLPDEALAEATNGEVYSDPYGEFSRIRAALLDMPEDVRLKRLAGQLFIMAQAGQYNFDRCLRHHEPDAAQLACVRFVEAYMKATGLLERRYTPFYKWSFRALRSTQNGPEIEEILSRLLAGDNRDGQTAQVKRCDIETLASRIILTLQQQGLTDAVCGDLEKHAYSVNDHVRNGEIRNLHLLTCV